MMSLRNIGIATVTLVGTGVGVAAYQFSSTASEQIVREPRMVKVSEVNIDYQLVNISSLNQTSGSRKIMCESCINEIKHLQTDRSLCEFTQGSAPKSNPLSLKKVGHFRKYGAQYDANSLSAFRQV